MQNGARCRNRTQYGIFILRHPWTATRSRGGGAEGSRSGRVPCVQSLHYHILRSYLLCYAAAGRAITGPWFILLIRVRALYLNKQPAVLYLEKHKGDNIHRCYILL